MIIERIVAKKSLAVTLALALFASAPMSAWSQTQSAAARAGNSAGIIGAVGSMGAVTSNMSAVMAPVTLPSLSLNAPAPVVAPAVKAMAAAPIASAQAMPAAALPLAVEAHPVIGLINALQAKGIVLPETMSTRQDAAKLIAAAQAMPEGMAKHAGPAYEFINGLRLKKV